MPSMTTDTTSVAKPTHRACDECRTRKLACSKDQDGCDRCKRENIPCRYSEQKPMGRPRKRQFIETTAESAALHHHNPQDPIPLPFSADDLNYNDGSIAEPFFITGQPLIAPETLGTEIIDGRVMWHFGDRQVLGGPPINFGDIDFGSGDNVIPSLDPPPQLSTMSNPSVTDSENSPPPSTACPCSCLSSMYLSLAALQQFPTDIVSALRIVRGAAATAAASLWCPQCGSVLLDIDVPPIESFQNTMLLGTILPIIANGYQKLLKMIDEEAEAANAAGRMKVFQFQDYGGMCGNRSTALGALQCVEKEMLFNAIEMPPAQWRTTVRALLRVDIYGHEQPGFTHKGLKDLVNDMEFRQRTRHELMNAAEADGTLDINKVGHGLFKKQGEKCLGEKTHGCLEILRMAKMAIDELVIA